MNTRARFTAAGLVALASVAGLGGQTSAADAQVTTVQGMPPVLSPHNIFSETTSGQVAPEIAHDLQRIYVPNLRSARCMSSIHLRSG